ncbi:hypothetical protein OV090_00185 [Nannocystis sp. RBIL2]|uniref:hypothetical protein n=1 Tax=Nannocystis sp. RBIL2 TaxID=2996788 RepID=UPI002270A546|nr:hypothetical protein [Nannocystis sp. RBIL2]MCY1063158.1 hypothetical protein [Nannocystis sp. RBIL2]
MTRTNSIFRRLAPLTLALACEAAGGTRSTDQPLDDVDDGEPAGISESSGPGPTGPGHDVGPGPAFQCDPWQQDCPPGQKCNLYSLDGDPTLDGAKCVPLDESPAQVGELCLAEDGYGAGPDDCDAGLLCWNVIPSGQGVCVQVCDGQAATPQCPESQLCTKGFGDYHYKCLHTCNPLAQDCIEGEMCAAGDAGFVCAPDVSGEGGHIYDACTAANDCDRGLMCSPSEAAPMCQASPEGGCCLPYCELGGVCPDGLECYDFEAWNEPPELIDVGACGLVP